MPETSRRPTWLAGREIQERIQRQIDTLVGAGAETGVQVAVYQDGALIVDAVAGTADPATGRPVTSGTPIFSFSTAKNVGFPLGRIGAPAEENSAAFGWPGGGGSYAYADPTRGIAFALTKTRLVPNFDTALSVTTILADHLAATR